MIVEHNGQKGYAKEVLMREEVQERIKSAISKRDWSNARKLEAQELYAKEERQELEASREAAEWEAALAEFPDEVPGNAQDGEAEGEVI